MMMIRIMSVFALSVKEHSKISRLGRLDAQLKLGYRSRDVSRTQ